MTTETSEAKLNIYDKLLFLQIIIQIFGIIGDAFQPIRLFTIFLTPLLITSIIKNLDFYYKYKYEFFLYIVWFIYGIITLLFSIYLDESLKELAYILINILSFFLLLYLSTKSNNPKRIIILSWIFIFVITAPIALIELFYDIHLPISAQEEGLIMKYDDVVFDRIFASVTFGNLNGYNTILMYIYPFILSPLFELKSKKITLFYLIIVLTILFIIISNGSRAALIITILITLFFIFYRFSKKNIIIISIIIVFISTFVVSKYFDELFFVYINRFEAQGFSDEGRAYIVQLSLAELIDSYFFGVGTGNLKPLLAEKYNLDNFAPHSLLLEVGVQYGAIILILYIIQFFKIFKFGIKNSNLRDRFIINSSLISLPLITIIDSSYILSSSIWLFVGSLYIISDSEYTKTF